MDGDISVWVDVGGLDDIPRLGSRVVATPAIDIALFRTADDRVFALHDRCPHKAGKLSQGIVHGESVTCPLHNWVIGLSDGQAKEPDEGCARTVPVRLEDGRILLAVGGA
jgi:nitrite reductase (NADH) small subunit